VRLLMLKEAPPTCNRIFSEPLEKLLLNRKQTEVDPKARPETDTVKSEHGGIEALGEFGRGALVTVLWCGSFRGNHLAMIIL